MVLGRFEDEDDLYTEVDKAKAREEDLEYEDAGVCLASVSSSSPASSKKGAQQPLSNSTPDAVRRKIRPIMGPQVRPPDPSLGASSAATVSAASPDLCDLTSSTKITDIPPIRPALHPPLGGKTHFLLFVLLHARARVFIETREIDSVHY